MTDTPISKNERSDDDPLSAVKGIMLGFALSTLIWAAIVAWWLS